MVSRCVRPPRAVLSFLCMRVLQAHTFGVLPILCPFPLCPQRPLESSAGIAFGEECGSLKSKPVRDTLPVRNCPEDNKSTLCPANKTLGSPASRGPQPQFPSCSPSCPSRPNSTRLPAVPRNAHTPFRLLTKALCQAGSVSPPARPWTEASHPSGSGVNVASCRKLPPNPSAAAFFARVLPRLLVLPLGRQLSCFVATARLIVWLP